MSLGVKNFRGERLKEARLARGLFKNALGDMIGVTGVAIARYEDGIDNPQAAKVAALAQQLNFPIDFFVTPAWPEEINLVHWRSRSSESKSAREMTEQRIRWLCEVYAFLESELDFPPLLLPDSELPADFKLITNDQIEKAAGLVRKAWGLNLSPIPDMILALENAGIPVATLRIPSDKQDGFCFYSEALNKAFVGINIDETSCARARFDAAHELGHIVLHRNVSADHAKMPAHHKLIEQQAHRFAGAFLFPKEAFRSEARVISLDYLCSLKKRWGMSIGAMVMRAAQLELIEDDEKQTLFRNMTYRKWRGPLAEPFDSPDEMPLERPRMLRRGVQVLIDAGNFAKSSILSSLPHPPAEIEELASLDHDFFKNQTDLDLKVGIRPDFDMLDLESGNVVEFKRPDRSHRR